MLPAGQVLLYRVIVIVTLHDAGQQRGLRSRLHLCVVDADRPVHRPDVQHERQHGAPPPIAVGDSVTLNAASPGSSTFIDVLGNDSGTFSTYPVSSGSHPTKGTVSASSTGIVTYTANSGASGTDYFTYYLSDVTGRPPRQPLSP